MFNPAAILPRILPKAIAWAEARSIEIIAKGTGLDADALSVARQVGVQLPEEIRVSYVDRMPLPEDPELRAVALQTGLLGPSTIGLTLGHGIYAVNKHWSITVLSHECRHVYQFERAGSIAAFLPQYLGQIATFGYANAPLEVDARAHEIHVA